MLTATQRLLGLPLTCLNGLPCDPFGDEAINTNLDYTLRHNASLDAWIAAFKKGLRGKKVRRDGYIDDDCHPDGTIYDFPRTGVNTYLEAKLKSPLDHSGVPYTPDAEQAAFAGLGTIMDDIEDKYGARLQAKGHQLYKLVADTFGALHPESRKHVHNARAFARGLDRPGADPSDPSSNDDTSDSDDDQPASGRPSAPGPNPLLPISIAVHVAIASHIHRYADNARSSGARAA